jgi:hypothetical protein
LAAFSSVRGEVSVSLSGSKFAKGEPRTFEISKCGAGCAIFSGELNGTVLLLCPLGNVPKVTMAEGG